MIYEKKTSQLIAKNQLHLGRISSKSLQLCRFLANQLRIGCVVVGTESMQRKVALGSLLLGVILLVKHVLTTECMRDVLQGDDDRRCLFQDRVSCKRAQGSECEWCELPQECYHQELVRKLGVNCNGSQRRQLKEVEDCANVASKHKCLSLDHCRWCRSEALDDGCFRAWDARRLPSQVFDCSKES